MPCGQQDVDGYTHTRLICLLTEVWFDVLWYVVGVVRASRRHGTIGNTGRNGISSVFLSQARYTIIVGVECLSLLGYARLVRPGKYAVK